MGINYNPRTVTDGLVLHLDAANVKSYPGSGNIWKNVANTSIPNASPVSGFNQQCYWNSNGYFSIDSDFDDPQPNAILTSTLNSHIGHTIPTEFRMDNNTQERTYEAWFRVTNHSKTSNGGPIFTTMSSTGCSYGCNGGIEIHAGYIKGVHYNTTDNYNIIGSVYAAVNSWFHAVLTYNPGENPNKKLYINGSLNASFNTADWTYSSGGAFYEIGFHRKSNAPTTFCGDIAIVKMYMDKALSAQEVEQNFQATRGRFGI